MLSYYIDGRRHEPEPTFSENGVDVFLIQNPYDPAEITRLARLAYAGEPISSREVIAPGGCLALAQGQLETVPERIIPDWMPAKLRTNPIMKVGAYSIAWPYDPNGNAPGGEGIAKYWFDGRTCLAGYTHALLELLGVINRCRFFYGDRQVEDEVGLFALTGYPYNTPERFRINYERCLRWDLNCMGHLGFQMFDDQHLHRAARAAIALRGVHPLADWFLEQLVRWIRLRWAPRDIPDTVNTNYWTTRQWLAQADYTIRAGLGRGTAHAAGVIWEVEPDSELATDFDEMVLRAGVPFFLNDSPGYAPWAREPNGGPFLRDEPICMTREPMLFGQYMTSRPRLSGVRRQALAWHGTRPGGVKSADGEEYGTPNADYELFYGDFQIHGSPANMLAVASRRPLEMGPFCCCPRRFWQEALR